MCRCAERRVVLGGVAQSLVRRDLAGVQSGLVEVASSVVADVRALPHAALQAAHARLARKSR